MYLILLCAFVLFVYAQTSTQQHIAFTCRCPLCGLLTQGHAWKWQEKSDPPNPQSFHGSPPFSKDMSFRMCLCVWFCAIDNLHILCRHPPHRRLCGLRNMVCHPPRLLGADSRSSRRWAHTPAHMDLNLEKNTSDSVTMWRFFPVHWAAWKMLLQEIKISRMFLHNI